MSTTLPTAATPAAHASPPHAWQQGVTDGHLTPRPGESNRYDVTDGAAAEALFGCAADDWCIVQDGHPGACCDDRETWVQAADETGAQS